MSRFHTQQVHSKFLYTPSQQTVDAFRLGYCSQQRTSCRVSSITSVRSNSSAKRIFRNYETTVVRDDQRQNYRRAPSSFRALKARSSLTFVLNLPVAETGLAYSPTMQSKCFTRPCLSTCYFALYFYQNMRAGPSPLTK